MKEREWTTGQPFRLAGVLSLSLVLATASSGQGRLQHEVSVTLKLIQVYVTDKNNSPVTDLVKGEFSVFDNGEPVEITDFEKRDVRAGPPGMKVEENKESTPSGTAGPLPIKRKFILFFDFAFNTAKGVSASVRAALDFIDAHIGPQDEVALLSYSMLKGVRIHEVLTPDAARIRKAVTEITAKDISGRADEVEQAYWQMIELSRGDTTGRAEVELSRIEMQRQDSIRQAQNYLISLTSLARALRMVEGQKSVLFFSSGIPSSLIYSRGSAGTDEKISQRSGGKSSPARGSQFEISNPILLPLQETMLKEFTASNCAFYSFDTREFSKLPSLFSYDELAFTTRLGGMFGSDGVHQSTSDPFRDDKTTGKDTLRSLSKQTGGQYYSNISLYEESFKILTRLTDSYYVLGFPVPETEDGQFHKIEVKVSRRGCRVRAPRGYFNPKPFRDYSKLEKDLHLFELALNERFNLADPASLSVQALTYDTGQGARIRVIARVTPSMWDAFKGSSVEIISLFITGDDRLRSLQRSVVDLSGPRAADSYFTVGALADSDRMKCRFILRDMDTGVSAVARADSFVGRGTSGLSVGTPLIFLPGKGVSMIEGIVKGNPEKPDWREVYQFNPSLARPILAGEPIDKEDFILTVPVLCDAGSEEGLLFKLILVESATGRSLDLPYVALPPSWVGTICNQQFSVSTGGIPQGSYRLYVHTGHKMSPARASASVPLALGRR